MPRAGELIIYDADASHDSPRFKVGDGVTTVTNLPFAGGVSNEQTGVFRITRTINPGDWVANTDASSSGTYPYVWSETGEVYNTHLEVVEVRWLNATKPEGGYLISPSSSVLRVYSTV